MITFLTVFVGKLLDIANWVNPMNNSLIHSLEILPLE